MSWLCCCSEPWMLLSGLCPYFGIQKRLASLNISNNSTVILQMHPELAQRTYVLKTDSCEAVIANIRCTVTIVFERMHVPVIFL